MLAAADAEESFGAIVSDLISLVEHVQASISLIEGAIARETSVGDGEAANVIVLDDVTPQYLKAGHALHSCSANLDAALRSLFDARASAHAAATGGRPLGTCRACIANRFSALQNDVPRLPRQQRLTAS